MNLYKNIEHAQEDDLKSLESIINLFEPKINSLATHTNYQNKDDLKQELIEQLIILIKKYNLTDIPDYDKFVNRYIK